jgi:hypothetical protein
MSGELAICPAKWIVLKVGSFDRSLLKTEAGRFLEKCVPGCDEEGAAGSRLQSLLLTRDDHDRNAKHLIYAQ